MSETVFDALPPTQSLFPSTHWSAVALAAQAGSEVDASHEALGRLRDDEAEVLRLWAWEQLTPGEIATVLAVTPNAISLRLLRARERLKAEIGKIEAGAGHEQSEGGPR